MHRLFVSLLLIVFALPVFAGESPIENRSIDIQYSSETPADHQLRDEDPGQFWKTDSLEKFAYTWAPPRVEPEEKDSLSGETGYVSAFLGNQSRTGISALYYPRTDSLLRFVLDAGMFSPETDWKTSAFSLGWMGQFPSMQAWVSPGWGQEEFSLREAADSTGEGSIRSMVGLSAGVEMARIHAGDSLVVDDLLLQAAAFTHTLELPRRKIELSELDGRGAFKLKYLPVNLFVKTDIAFLRTDTSGELLTGFEDFLGFDRVAAYLAVDANRFLPSVAVSRRIDLDYNLFVWVANNPRIERVSRPEILGKNPWQDVHVTTLQEKAPLDATVSLNLTGQVPASAGVRVEKRYDHTVYYQTSPTGLYEGKTVDAWVGSVFAQGSYAYDILTISDKFTLTFTNADQCVDDKLPHIPGIENLLEVRVNRRHFVAGLDFRWLSDRFDYLGNEMDPAFLVDFNAEVKISRELYVQACVDNLFNQDYRRYINTPKLGVGFFGGLKWIF